MYYIPYKVWDTVYCWDWLEIKKSKIVSIYIWNDWVRYEPDFAWQHTIWKHLTFEEIAPTKRMLKEMYKQYSKTIIEKRISDLD